MVEIFFIAVLGRILCILLNSWSSSGFARLAREELARLSTFYASAELALPVTDFKETNKMFRSSDFSSGC